MLEVWAILKSLATVIGFIRMVMKPIMTIIEKAVEETETEKDDVILEKILGSSIYKALAWIIDYLGSIKIDATQRIVGATVKKK